MKRAIFLIITALAVATVGTWLTRARAADPAAKADTNAEAKAEAKPEAKPDAKPDTKAAEEPRV
ncbi:MAG: hypothetical protein JWQ04_2689, partial [Pedosphaera sp.]|nr:hypothetical protein [Pedosphaera sp.]